MDLYYTDPAQHLTTSGRDLDDLDDLSDSSVHDLSDLSVHDLSDLYVHDLFVNDLSIRGVEGLNRLGKNQADKPDDS